MNLTPKAVIHGSSPTHAFPSIAPTPTSQGKAGQGRAAATHPCQQRAPSAPLPQPGAAPGLSPALSRGRQCGHNAGQAGGPGPRGLHTFTATSGAASTDRAGGAAGGGRRCSTASRLASTAAERWEPPSFSGSESGSESEPP